MDGILKDKDEGFSTPELDAACNLLRQQVRAIRALRDEDSPVIEQVRKVRFKDGKCYLWIPFLEKDKGVWMDAHAVAWIVNSPSLSETMAVQPMDAPTRKGS